MTVIMTAFPGQFSYSELINFDVRELNHWGNKAQKTLLQTQLKDLLMVRAALGDIDCFNSVKNELELRIREMDVGKETIVKEAWEDLKKTERRK